MAELPRTPFNTSETKPIRYNLSAADIAGPYTEIARASDKAAGALSDVSVPLAEDAASKVVRRDDSGNLIVDQLPPLLGDAGKAARLTIAGKLQPQIETDLLKQKLDHPNDPVGFNNSVSAYKPQLLQGMDSQLAVGVGKMVDNTSQQYLRSLMVERDNHETQEKIQTYTARQKEMDDRSGQIAFQHGTDQPEYVRLRTDRKTLFDDMENDSRVKMSHERRVLIEQESFDKDQAQAIIGSTYRNYQTNKDAPGAKAEAHRFLIDQFLGEPGNKLHMTVEKRLHYVSEGTSMLEAASAKDTLAIADHNKSINMMIDQVYADPRGAYNPAAVQAYMDRAKDLNDPKGVRLLQGLIDNYPLIKSLGSLSGPEAADVKELMASDPQSGIGTPTEALYWKTMEKLKERAGVGAVEAEKRLKERAGVPGAQFTVEEFNEALHMATVGGKPEVEKSLRSTYAGLALRQQVPPGGMDKAIAAAKEAKAAPMSPAQAEMNDIALKKLEADKEGYQKDPLPTAYNAGVIMDKPGPWDTSNPAAFTGAMQVGQKSADLLQQRWRNDGAEFGPVKVVSGVDAQAVGQQLLYGDPKNVGPALQAFSALNDANYKATLDQKEIQEAVVGASQSNDPLRFAPAMQEMRNRWKKDPVTFGHVWGADTLERVQAFAGMDGMPIEEKIKHLNYANDPAEASAAKTRAEKAKEEMKDWSTQDIANKIGGGVAFVGRVTGSRPAAPVDENQADILHGEFSEHYEGLRKFGVPAEKAADLAAERLGSEWQTSVANRGQLMKYAPEKYNKPIGDPKSPDAFKYLPEDLDKHMTEVLGPAVTFDEPKVGIAEAAQAAMGEGGMARRATVHWNLVGPIGDERTRQEAERGESPSYLIHYTDQNGKDQFLDHRWKWDSGETGMPEEKAYLGQTEKWSRNVPLGPMPSAVPTGHFAEYEKGQRAAAESRQTVMQQLMRPGGPAWFGNKLAAQREELLRRQPAYNHDAHVEARDGGR